MSRQVLTSRWAGRMLLAVMVLVTGAVGFCLFHDGAASHHVMSLDLCTGLAIVSVVAIVAVFTDAYSVPVGPQHVLHPVALHRLDPPPKFASLS